MTVDRDARGDHQATWSWPEATLAGLRDMAPMLIAVAPLGLVVGVTVHQSAVGAPVGLGSAPTVFAGTAQLSILTLVQAHAGVLAIVVSVALINARIVLYSAALEPCFRDQSGWFRWIGPHFLVDQTFALATARHDLTSPDRFRRYWVGLGALFVLAWTALVAVGMAIGTAAGPALDSAGPVLAFAPVAVFLPLLVPRLGNRPGLIAAITAGVVTGATSTTGALPAGIPVLLGAVAGVLAAVLVDGRAS